MARYTGPKSKIARKFGEPIYGPDKVLSKKNYPPGIHGNNRRKKTSEYGIQYVSLELNTSISPAVIVPADGEESFLYMVLPVRLKA